MKINAIRESFGSSLSYVLSLTGSQYKEFLKHVTFVEDKTSKVKVKCAPSFKAYFLQPAFIKSQEIVEGQLLFHNINQAEVFIHGPREAIMGNYLSKRDDEVISLTLEV